MQMTQNPHKFKYLDRLTSNDNRIRMNLAPEDIQKRIQLEKKIR